MSTRKRNSKTLEEKYNMEDCQAIFIPPEEDTHQDHKKVSVIGKALTRKSKCSIIDYKTPHTLDHWTPNLFVDVEIQYRDKIKTKTISDLKKYGKSSRNIIETLDYILKRNK